MKYYKLSDIKQQKFIVSQFWRLEVSRTVLLLKPVWEEPALALVTSNQQFLGVPWLADGITLITVSIITLHSSKRLCLHLFLKGHQLLHRFTSPTSHDFTSTRNHLHHLTAEFQRKITLLIALNTLEVP